MDVDADVYEKSCFTILKGSCCDEIDEMYVGMRAMQMMHEAVSLFSLTSGVLLLDCIQLLLMHGVSLPSSAVVSRGNI